MSWRGQITGGSPLYLAGFIAISAVGAVFFFHLATLNSWWQSRELSQAGVETTARVLAIELSRQPRSVDRCLVKFEYDTVEAGLLLAETDVSSDFCQIFSPGSEIGARYLAGRAAVVQLDWGSQAEDRLLLLLLFDGLIGFLIVVMGVRYFRRQNADVQADG